MQRRHIEIIAEAMNKSISRFSHSPNGPWTVSEQSKRDCEDLADAFRADDINFDRKQFLKVCGIED